MKRAFVVTVIDSVFCMGWVWHYKQTWEAFQRWCLTQVRYGTTQSL